MEDCSGKQHWREDSLVPYPYPEAVEKLLAPLDSFVELPSQDLMDALSLTRERVRLWVSADQL